MNFDEKKASMFNFSNFVNPSDDLKRQKNEHQPSKVGETAPKITLNLPTPTEIYSTILCEVENLFNKITGGYHESEQINEAKKQCHELLSQIHSRVSKKVAELENNAEWNEFTIAFYGETNAGKSTIIEALRIHLSEVSKKAEQDAFIMEMAKAGLSKANFENAQHAVKSVSLQLIAFESDFVARTSASKSVLEAMERAIAAQQQLVVSIKEAAPFWKKLFFLIWAPKEARDAKQMAAQWQSKKEEVARDFDSLRKQHQSLKAAKTATEQVFAELTHKLDTLAQFADGRIIGDGRSDFTRETRAYRFETKHGKFALLDVPGIEGKEQVVIDDILKAVQKAHAVFYITSKAAPPQKGEKGQAGTLEKIKAHLNDQSEVWTIFNKRITNPMQFNGEMVSEDEQASLNMLDDEMRKQLKNHYAGTVTVAARPAFLAVAQCLVPFGQDEKNKEKFITKFSAEELIECSGFAALSQKIGSDILVGFPAKIRKSNFTKATSVLNEAIRAIKEVREENIEPLIKSLRKTETAASIQLAGALEELNADFIAETDSQIEKFKSSARQKIYRKIDRDISNDDFKDALESILEAELPNLNTRITQSAEAVFDKFKKSAERALEDYKRQTAELQSIHGGFDGGQLHSSFNLNIKIDNGINAAGLVSALIGGALLWWNPGGWVIIAAGVVTTLVGAYKAVCSFLSSDYKKQQQREAADMNISNVGWEVESSASSTARGAIDKIREQLQKTEASLMEPIHTMTMVSDALGNSVKSLTALSNAVQTQSVA
jgi:GTPase SAR1 family protein